MVALRLVDYSEELDGIYCIEGTGLSSNVYALGEADVTLIDAGIGDAANRLLPELEDIGLHLEDTTQVVLTHAHPDHVGGLREILRVTSPRILIHDSSKTFGKNSELNIFGLCEGDTIEAGGRGLTVLHTPGHTIGSICLYDSESKVLFSGDTVFPNGSFGRTDLDTGDEVAMVNSLERLTHLDVDFLLPGHMAPVIGHAHDHIVQSYGMAKSFFQY